jgi:hypothetical protein
MHALYPTVGEVTCLPRGVLLSDEYNARILHSYLRRLLNRYHYLTEVETRLALILKYAVDQSKQNAILAYSAFISIE